MFTKQLYEKTIVVSLFAVFIFLGFEFASAQSRGELTQISFLDLSGRASDVWAHGNFAYVGGLRPSSPVRIIDISDPENPQLVTTLPNPTDGSSPLDVKVATINTGFFSGDLLIVANEGTGPIPGLGPGGIQLWDVTDPTNPALLSEPRFGPVHNTYLYQKENQAFVLLAMAFAEVFSGPDPQNPSFGDFVIVEVTDPTNPQMIADWGAGKDGGFPFGLGPNPFGLPVTCLDTSICRGTQPAVFCHDIWANESGTVAYLSFWDLALILLDISDPTNPTFIGRGIEPPTFGGDEGNLHVAVPAQGSDLVVVGDEALGPLFGGSLPWGFLRIFDTSDPSNPVQIGAFATDCTLNNPQFTFSMHNIIVHENLAYLSWYFEGIRVVDLSNPFEPQEIAVFKPDPAEGRGFFWGVYVHNNLILASSKQGGFFILQLDTTATDVTVSSNSVPTNFVLHQNFPNPFNPNTTIKYQIPELSFVTLIVYDVLGKQVATLVNEKMTAGSYEVEFNATDLPSGIYFYRIQAGDFIETKKMLLMK